LHVLPCFTDRLAAAARQPCRGIFFAGGRRFFTAVALRVARGLAAVAFGDKDAAACGVAAAVAMDAGLALGSPAVETGMSPSISASFEASLEGCAELGARDVAWG
jgi:hypothetical protein